MKKLIPLLVLAALISSQSFAATKGTPAVVSEPAVRNYSHSDQIQWGASFGLGTLGSKFHLGVGLKGQVPFTIDNNDFKFGLRSGFYLGPSDSTDWVLPILATSEYDFRVANDIKPYVGLEIGLSIDHASYSYNDGHTGVDFALLFVPGAHFGQDQKYFFEVPFGTMWNSFTILPSIGTHF